VSTDVEVRVAVLETRMDALEKARKSDTDNLLEAVDGIRADIKDIYEFINKSKGSIASLILIASGVSGTVVAVVSWALTHFLH